MSLKAADGSYAETKYYCYNISRTYFFFLLFTLNHRVLSDLGSLSQSELSVSTNLYILPLLLAVCY